MDALSRAGDFLAAHGRDVERAAFERHFGGLSAERFLEVLGRYQNADGGFGRRLEVDVQADASNPFATELALALFRQCEAPADHPVVRSTVEYLELTQTEDGDWRFTPDVYAADLAPWFQGWEFPNVNPGCTTAGLLRDLGVGSERLHSRAEALFQRQKKVRSVVEGDFYSVRPYAMYFLPEWDHPERELWLSGVLWWLLGQDVSGKIADNGHFFEYVRGPNTYLGRSLPREILDAAARRARRRADGRRRLALAILAEVARLGNACRTSSC